MGYPPQRRGRISMWDRQRANLARMKLQNSMMPDDDPRKVVNAKRLAEWEASIPPKREYVKRPVDGRPANQPLERDIQKACLMLLRVHPRVGGVWRQNSGTFTEQNADGTQRYISAHTMPGLPDILGFLKDGGRMFAFEVKRPGNKATPLQQQFIDRAAAAGVIAAVITDPNQILDLIP